MKGVYLVLYFITHKVHNILMKKSLLISTLILFLIAGCLLFAVNYYSGQRVIVDNIQPSVEQTLVEEKPVDEVKPTPLPPGMTAEKFSGILQEVNVGCFVDGECYVVVDGKHVTAIMGWNSEITGTIIGVDGFGDLENYIDERVEVYAQNKNDGFYSLYGSQEFYIKLVNSGGFSARLNETKDALGTKITPLQVLEDSRCPIDVQCIQAGTVRLQANIETIAGVSEQIFVLNESVKTENQTITLVNVEPISDSKTKIDNSEYNFMFKIVSNK